MSGCTASGKPLVSIVMAVYEPNLDWLRAQLISLNAQTYPHLELLVRDDGSPTVPFAEICRCVEQHITAFPFEIRRNEKNLGSNATFERLTLEARGAFIAYCDQDDVWMQEKVETLLPFFHGDVALVCSDMVIIDGGNRRKADSITKVRKRHVFRSGGAELAEKLLFSNFVTGCAMMIRSETAKAAAPFCPYMVHDHYLALYTALKGQIRAVPQPLLCYRLHGGNQTGVMAGVFDKQSYLEIRIEQPLNRLYWLLQSLSDYTILQAPLKDGIRWLEARRDNMQKVPGSKKTIWKYRQFGPLAALFEILASPLPEAVFMLPIRLQARK